LDVQQEQFGSCWESLEDPRSGNAALHDFHELLMIALCCVLCGGQGAVDMALFAAANEPFPRSNSNAPVRTMTTCSASWSYFEMRLPWSQS